MSILQFQILYPELLPGDTPEARAFVGEILGANTTVIRHAFVDLADVPHTIRNDTHVLMIYKHRVTEHHLDLFPDLRVIVRLGVGTDRVDIAAAKERNITVHNVPDYGSSVVAFHALQLAGSLMRNLTGYDHTLRGSGPMAWDPTDALVSRAPWDLTLGIVGFGRIGSELGRMAATALFKVVFYDPYLEQEYQPIEGIERVQTLEELLPRSDVLSLNVPDTEETRGMISSLQLGSLPRGAKVINTGRGSALNLDAVVEGIKSGQLGGVGLDVLPVEPPREKNLPALVRAYRNNEEWTRGTVVITPHSASHSPLAIQNIHTKSATTAIKALNGVFENVVQPGGY